MPMGEATGLVRALWTTPREEMLQPERFPLLRRVDAAAGDSPYRNVVLILMESFSARRTGILGGPGPIAVTPRFDRLAGEGLLFDRFFSNGTHTHQGMFATVACFPNLPRYEYLMQQPEGVHHFSGLPKILSERGYHGLYVYNGDAAWDNQFGFFSAQGVSRFITRHDFVDPRFTDPTWGVSDQDMFDRALQELAALEEAGRPYYAILQTLSNHTPYALPDPLPVAPVMAGGAVDERLTAMRYADHALGEFFDRVRGDAAFADTLFVLVGDHGFGGAEQVTEMDLWRFNVPLLFWGSDIQARFGARRSIVGTQVDVVPTIMGLLGGDYTQHCWGRCRRMPRGWVSSSPPAATRWWQYCAATPCWSSAPMYPSGFIACGSNPPWRPPRSTTRRAAKR
jgi:phosphoglycerol transferase MdoB-like AlkP superfamily enzyme